MVLEQMVPSYGSWRFRVQLPSHQQNAEFFRPHWRKKATISVGPSEKKRNVIPQPATEPRYEGMKVLANQSAHSDRLLAFLFGHQQLVHVSVGFGHPDQSLDSSL